MEGNIQFVFQLREEFLRFGKTHQGKVFGPVEKYLPPDQKWIPSNVTTSCRYFWGHFGLKKAEGL